MLKDDIITLSTLQVQAKEKESRMKEEFIKARTRHEDRLEIFRKGLESIPAHYIQNIPIPVSLAPKDIFPSLYVQPFNQENYNREYAEFSRLQDQIREVLQHIVTVSTAALKEYLNG